MTRLTALFTLTTIATILNAACATPRFDSVPVKRLPPSGDEILELDARLSSMRLASRLVEVPGESDLSLFLDSEDPSAPLLFEVVTADGEPIARGAAPLTIQHLPRGRYVVVVRLARGTTRVRLATVLLLHDPDERSGPDSRMETATVIESGRLTQGRVDWFALDSTDHLAIETEEGGHLRVLVDFARQRGVVMSTLITPEDVAYELVPGHEVELEGTEAGRYVVRIRAAEGGAADYSVTTTYTPRDPDGSRDLATEITLHDGLELQGTVDASRGDREDWFRFDTTATTRIHVDTSAHPTRHGVELHWMPEHDSENVRLDNGKPLLLEPGPHHLRVRSRQDGPIAYSFVLRLKEEEILDSKLLERNRRDGCVLVIDRGSRDRLRTGTHAMVISEDSETLGVVEQVFRGTSVVRVRDADSDCAYGPETTVRVRVAP